MFTPRRIGPTLVDALPHVRAKNLQPGDLIAHRGRPGFDEAGGRPVIRIDPSKTEGRVRRCLSCSGPGAGRQPCSPASCASTAAWTRLVQPVRVRMLLMWALTVPELR